MPAPTFINSTAAATSSTSGAFNTPTSTAAGDLILFHFVSANQNAQISAAPDAGWVRLKHPWVVSAGDGASQPYNELWGKIATVGESATQTWTWNATGNVWGIHSTWRSAAGSWTVPGEAIVAMKTESRGAGGDNSPALPNLGAQVWSTSDFAQIAFSTTQRGDGTVTAPASWTSMGNIAQGGFDNGTLIKGSIAYRIGTGVLPYTGNFTYSNTRGEFVHTMMIKSASDPNFARVKEAVGSSQRNNFNCFTTQTSGTLWRSCSSVAGDIEVLQVAQYNPTNYMDTPTGYTLWGRTVGNGSTANGRVMVYYRVCDGSETTTLGFTTPAGTDVIPNFLLIAGTGLSIGDIQFAIDNAQDTNLTMAPITVPATAAPGSVYGAFANLCRSDGNGPGGPSGYAQLISNRWSNSGANLQQAGAAVKVSTAANAGSTSYLTAGGSLNVSVTASWALVGAAAGGNKIIVAGE